MTSGLRSMEWILGGRKEDGDAKLNLYTRDLLGGGVGNAVFGSMVEAELNPPADDFWHGPIDSLSGFSAPANRRQLLDLNFPPASVFAEDSKILPVWQPAAAPSTVCTLEKVKLALEREMRSKLQGSTSLTSSTTSLSGKRRTIIEDGPESSSTAAGEEMMLAGCMHCFLHVMIAKSDPRCPRCNSHVREPALPKRSRIY